MSDTSAFLDSLIGIGRIHGGVSGEEGMLKLSWNGRCSTPYIHLEERCNRPFSRMLSEKNGASRGSIVYLSLNPPGNAEFVRTPVGY